MTPADPTPADPTPLDPTPVDVVVLQTARWLPADVLTAAGWDALRDRRVLAADPAHPLIPVLARLGTVVTVLPGEVGDAPTAVVASGVVASVLAAAPATWLESVGPTAAGAADDRVAARLVEAGAVRIVGSVDPPGARLLDAVRVMDRLRSPGGCPWDAEQTHESLTKYLIEEAYETVELIESGQLAELAEEIGDVLLQVLFHARVASERVDGTGWTVDDAAGGLVDKLVRRHPHVFGTVAVDGTADVIANWDVLKAQEKGRTSVTEGVPLAQPALALAEKLLARSGRAGLPEELADAGLSSAHPATALRTLLADIPAGVERDADSAAADADADAYVGRALLLTVALARRLGVNPETALRAAARDYRDRILAAETARTGSQPSRPRSESGR
ncbi:MAG: MazG family protein [Frankiales bacterium]|nr:MazG family protein [Frankiales bacterium]